MLAFILAVTINSLLFVGFLGVSVAHANGTDMPMDFDRQTDTSTNTQTSNASIQQDPCSSFIIENIHFPDTTVANDALKPLLTQRMPCFDKGFDVIIINQAALAGQPVVIDDLNDDDSLQINYQSVTNAEGEHITPKLSVENFADDTGAYIRLGGVTVAEIPDGQFMSPDHINLVAA